MGIVEQRLKQRQQQARAIASKGEGEVYRIGDRIPQTGSHELIYPDGSIDPNAIKLYGAKHEIGDQVLAQRRSDSAWLLSEAGARSVRAKPAASRFGDQRGYLQGRRFNLEEPQPKGTVLLVVLDFRESFTDGAPFVDFESNCRILGLPEAVISNSYGDRLVYPSAPIEPWLVTRSGGANYQIHFLYLDRLRQNVGGSYQVAIEAHWIINPDYYNNEYNRHFKKCFLALYLIQTQDLDPNNLMSFGQDGYYPPEDLAVIKTATFPLNIQQEYPADFGPNDFPRGQQVGTVTISNSNFTFS